MKEKSETRNEHGTRLKAVVVMVLVLGLSISVATVSAAVDIGSTIDSISFEIEGSSVTIQKFYEL